MKKVTKGVLASGLGVGLLVSGGGTLAYWTSGVDTGTNAINSGHLELSTDTTNTGCGGWFLDNGEDVVNAPFDPAVDLIVPGDVLTRDCAFTVTTDGEHLRATVTIGTANFTYTPGDDYGTAIHAVLDNVMVNGVATNVLTEDSTVLTATETVTFDYGTVADNSTQDVQAALDGITITATQQHG